MKKRFSYSNHARYFRIYDAITATAHYRYKRDWSLKDVQSFVNHLNSHK